MQGYLFSRPVDRETFERMLMDGLESNQAADH